MTSSKIKHRKLGRTGQAFFPIGLGGMPLSIEGRPPEAQAIEVVHAALDAGVDFIDTADVYCLNDDDLGHNERLIARALKLRGHPAAIRVATKGGLRRPRGAWTVDASPRHLREACEASLKNLGTDRIFLYQLHAPDDRVPIADSVGELAKLQREGKIEHIGVSNFDLAQLKQAQAVARIESVQNRCNLFEPEDVLGDLLQACAKDEVTFIPHSPVGGHHGHRALDKSAPVLEIAARHHVSPYQVALAWLLEQSEWVLPIPGASRVASIRDSVLAPQLTLEPEEVQALSRLSPAPR